MDGVLIAYSYIHVGIHESGFSYICKIIPLVVYTVYVTVINSDVHIYMYHQLLENSVTLP